MGEGGSMQQILSCQSDFMKVAVGLYVCCLVKIAPFQLNALCMCSLESLSIALAGSSTTSFSVTLFYLTEAKQSHSEVEGGPNTFPPKTGPLRNKPLSCKMVK